MQDIRRVDGWDASDLWKGLAAGLIGGLVASWTMNRFQDVWSKLVEGSESWPDNQFQNVWCEFAEGLKESPGSQVSKPGPEPDVQEDTTVRAASAVAESLFDHRLTQSEKKIAGPAVHYILGTGVGGLYGAAAE